MKTVTTIGLDIAKSVFQVHGIGAEGQLTAVSNAIRAQLYEYLDQQKQAIEAWGKYVESLVSGQPSAFNVVPLRAPTITSGCPPIHFWTHQEAKPRGLQIRGKSAARRPIRVT